MFRLFKKRESSPPAKRFPPVPDWKPAFGAPLDRIVERIKYYTNESRDFAIFEHGTCVVLEEGLSDDAARDFSLEVLRLIFHAHPDMNPMTMNDGNVLVRYNHPAVNLVLTDIAQQHWAEIDRRHQDALATDEVLITPLGPNQFDDSGKKALFGRCFMFMDAQSQNVVRIERKGGSLGA